jgi:TldD protein
VQVIMADTAKAILIANSEGVFVEDRQFISRLACQPTAIDGSNRQAGIAMAGGSVDADYFTNVRTPEETANEAADSAIALLSAVDAKAGSYPVIINHGWGGVLVHECFGHSLEGDGIRKKTSIREKQLNQKVASDIVDIWDDSTVPNARGSFKVDDEGTPSQKSHVVEKGILKGYLWDRLNAQLTGNVSTGNGRRNSYRDFPIPRMTNTYISAGTSKPADLFASVKNGLYCKNLGGGSVNPADGMFSFVVSEAYLIENGQLTSAVKGATLTGNAADAMLRVEGLGDDLTIDTKTGTCGKDGQFKPVGVGQPTVLFSEMTVGGTRA